MDTQQPATIAESRKAPIVVGSGAVLGDSAEAVETALMLVSISPVKTRMWMEAAMQMAEYCQGIENCDQAAMRVLANEVYRLRKTVEVAEGAINELRHKLKLNIKNLNVCEQKADEIIEHTTGGDRTRKAALEIRTAAVQHDLSPNIKAEPPPVSGGEAKGKHPNEN